MSRRPEGPRPRFGVLGEIVLFRDDGTVRFGHGRSAVVLARLLRRIGQPVSVEQLVDAVWDDDVPRTSSTMVHGAVRRLRSAIDPARGAGPGRVIGTRAGAYVVEPGAVWLDSVEFERGVTAGRALADGSPAAAVRELTAALALWRGPAYAGVEQAFARDEARRLDELRLDGFELLAGAHLSAGAHAEAVDVLAPVVASHPLREPAVRLLMLALYRGDRPADALALYRRTGRHLADELGTEPGAALRETAAAIRRRGPDLLWSRPSSPAPLPVPASSFVGRQEDVERIRDLLGHHRLVTVTGAGGAGKTRLAVEVGRCLPMRAVFVDLAAAGDADSFGETVAVATGVRSPGARMASSVAAALAAEPTLVLLDNCEHLRAVCAAFVRELVAASEHVHVLATSRVRLGLAAEQIHPLRPLPVPDPDERGRLDEFPGVRLFVDRAAAVRPGPNLSPDALAVVAEICRRLDGLPLALELAAARTSSMPVGDLLAALDDRFEVLDRSTSERGLAATIAWSHGLLSGSEQRLFAGLTVFRGSFDLDAVEHVLGVAGRQVRVAMAQLVEFHLVGVDAASGDRWRYRLLETTREFLRHRRPSGSREPSAVHARHYRAVVGRAAEQLYGPGSGRWLDLLHEERDNIRAALEWSTAAGDDEVLIGLCGSLWHYWDVRGSRAEGVRWLGVALAAVGAGREERMALLSALALLHLGLGDFDETDRCAAEQHDLAAAVADRRWVGDALAMRATTAWARGRFDRARQLYEDAIVASTEGGDVWRAAMEEAQLARLHRDRGEPDAARAFAIRACAHADDVGEELARGLARDVLASVEHRWGERATAAALVDEALGLYRSVGYREGEASALHLSGRIAAAGDPDRAADEMARALEIYRRIGHRAGVAETLADLAASEPTGG